MQTQPALTQEDMRDELGISLTAVRKLVGQLTEKNYVERNPKDGSWRVFITPSI
jgi:DNA-binding GntR family transcriptional regulator